MICPRCHETHDRAGFRYCLPCHKYYERKRAARITRAGNARPKKFGRRPKLNTNGAQVIDWALSTDKRQKWAAFKTYMCDLPTPAVVGMRFTDDTVTYRHVYATVWSLSLPRGAGRPMLSTARFSIRVDKVDPHLIWIMKR